MLQSAHKLRVGRIAELRASTDPALREAVKYRRSVGVTSLHRIRATLRNALNDAIPQGIVGAGGVAAGGAGGG